MTTDLRRTGQAWVEGSDGDSLVDWIPGQVGRLGPSLAWGCPKGPGEGGGGRGTGPH